ncbi:MAG: type II toxin-antitoxin system PemK/MazF family toxin [Clostridiales bacterium]|jgi:mRNA interferase MazF|nr:type II toxin-antitoxin system PemK/MazF family toxin [Clostridiales bacterium]
MVRQGDIIKISFNPQSGHEQAGNRPAVVISNDFFNMKTKLAVVCPITNTDNNFPLHIRLDNRTQTTGVVLCEHVKSMDVNSRTYKFIEKVPDDILKSILNTVFAEMEAN